MWNVNLSIDLYTYKISIYRLATYVKIYNINLYLEKKTRKKKIQCKGLKKIVFWPNECNWPCDFFSLCSFDCGFLPIVPLYSHSS